MQTTNISWSRWAIYMGILPAILFYLVLGLGPSMATVLLSFTDISGLPNVDWKFIGLDNYKEFFFLQNYRDTFDALKRTAVFSLSVTFFQNAAALLIALSLNNKFIKGRNFYRAVVFLPVVLGAVVTALTWTLFFNSVDGPAAKFLNLFGASCNFFGDRVWAFPLTIFCQCWMAMGYSMVIFLAGLQGIPTELYESGSIDGATPFQAFRHITFPLLWPTITVNVILALIGSLTAFQIILLTTGGGFDTTTLSMRVFSFAFGLGKGSSSVAGNGSGSLRQGYASAQSMILFVFVLVVMLISQRIMNRKEEEE